jgi:hypothetical protein
MSLVMGGVGAGSSEADIEDSALLAGFCEFHRNSIRNHQKHVS